MNAGCPLSRLNKIRCLFLVSNFVFFGDPTVWRAPAADSGTTTLPKQPWTFCFCFYFCHLTYQIQCTSALLQKEKQICTLINIEGRKIRKVDTDNVNWGWHLSGIGQQAIISQSAVTGTVPTMFYILHICWMEYWWLRNCKECPFYFSPLLHISPTASING